MANALLRLPAVQARTDLSRSTIYLRIAQGTFTKPVLLGGKRNHALGVSADLLQTLERGEKYKIVSINSKAAA